GSGPECSAAIRPRPPGRIGDASEAMSAWRGGGARLNACSATTSSQIPRGSGRWLLSRAGHGHRRRRVVVLVRLGYRVLRIDDRLDRVGALREGDLAVDLADERRLLAERRDTSHGCLCHELAINQDAGVEDTGVLVAEIADDDLQRAVGPLGAGRLR